MFTIPNRWLKSTHWHGIETEEQIENKSATQERYRCLKIWAAVASASVAGNQNISQFWIHFEWFGFGFDFMLISIFPFQFVSAKQIILEWGSDEGTCTNVACMSVCIWNRTTKLKPSQWRKKRILFAKNKPNLQLLLLFLFFFFHFAVGVVESHISPHGSNHHDSVDTWKMQENWFFAFLR